MIGSARCYDAFLIELIDQCRDEDRRSIMIRQSGPLAELSCIIMRRLQKADRLFKQ